MSESVGPQGLRQPSSNQDQSTALRPRAFPIPPQHLANSVSATAPPPHLFPGLSLGPPNNFPTDQHPGQQQQQQPRSQPQSLNQNQLQPQPQQQPQQQSTQQPQQRTQHQHQQSLQHTQPPQPHPQARAPPPRHISQRKGPHATSSILRMVAQGPCVQQLVKYNHEQRRGRIKNCVESFWKPFVETFFAPNATILLDFENTQNGTMALPVEAMPLILKSKHDAGLEDERLFMENPNEFNLENGMVVVDCPRTTMMSTFKESKVCTDGHLRVSFSKERKITLWEFSTQRHEELFDRGTFERGTRLPDPVCTNYGIPTRSVLLYTIAQSIYDMRDVFDSKVEALTNSPAAGLGTGPTPNANAGAGAIPTNGMPNGVGTATPSAVKDNAQKDTGNIITQLNETQSSMMPEKGKLSDAHASQLTNMQADFSMGLARAASNNQFDLDQATAAAPTANASVPSMDPSQMQLAQFQSQQQLQQQQQLQSQFNFQSRFPDSIRAMQTRSNPEIMLENALRNSNAAAAGAPSSQVQGTAAPSDALWPRGMLFEAGGKTAVNAPPPAPPGLMMFTPNNQGAVSAPNQPRPSNETDPSPTQNTMIGEALRESLNLDDIFGTGPSLPHQNGTAESGKRALAAASAAHLQGNGASKNKRRRGGGTQSSGML